MSVCSYGSDCDTWSQELIIQRLNPSFFIATEQPTSDTCTKL